MDDQTKNELTLLGFIDSLIAEKKDLKVTEKNLPVIRDAMLNQLTDMINTKLVSLLSDKEKLELSDLLSTQNSNDEIDSFFTDKIPDMQAQVTGVLMNFKAAFLTPVEKIIKK